MAKAAKGQSADDAREPDSRARLIQAATELFILRGYRDVSIREIADRARTNSALISYYFGDKEGLFMEVFKVVAEPLNSERMANFDFLEAAQDLSVESVVEAWVTPMFAGQPINREHPVAALSLSLNAEQGTLVEKLMAEVYDEVNMRFVDLLERCLPLV